jgi:hypothetical protein
MIPQYFPWLWDDRAAWEQVLSDPRYSYDLPLDTMIALYEERRVPALSATGGYSLAIPASLGTPTALPGPAAPMQSAFQTLAMQPQASFNAPSENLLDHQAEPETASDDGILSQAEIDALLAGA